MNNPLRLSKTLFLAGALALAPNVLFCAYTPKDPLFDQQWQWDPERNGINITGAWEAGWTGEGVVIGIIDSWVDINNPDLAPYYSKELSKDFNASPDTSKYPYLGEMHGTFVAGCAAAAGENEIGGLGAAFKATIAALHVGLGAENLGLSGQAILQSFAWGNGVSSESGAYESDALIRIKNCSFGSGEGARYVLKGYEEDYKLIKQGTRNNVIYVFAAGNDRITGGGGSAGNADSNGDPYGALEDVIKVAATQSTEWAHGTEAALLYSTFSNYGSCIFVAAPGTQVVSTSRVREETEGDDSTNDELLEGSDSLSPYYEKGNGTSYAAPILSGVLALAAQKNIAMDARWAKWALANTSVQIDAENKSWVTNAGGLHFSNDYGFGLVDAEAFVNYATGIAYETIRTTTTVSGGSGKNVWNAGAYSAPIRLTETALGTQAIESVELSFTVSDINFYRDLKITIKDPNGVESVVLDKTAMSAADQIAFYQLFITQNDGNNTLTWNLVSNAFWGTGAEKATGTWEVIFENKGENLPPASIGAIELKFNMGKAVTESSAMSVFSGNQLDIHALVLDNEKSAFAVQARGELRVEDSIILNAGTLNVLGKVSAYTTPEWNKGIKLYVAGGARVFVDGSGEIVLKRGGVITGGNVQLQGGKISGAGDFVLASGTIYANGDNPTIAQTLKMYGGTLTSAASIAFTVNGGVLMEGGVFNASGQNNLLATINGGRLNIAGTTVIASGVNIGATLKTSGTMIVPTGAVLQSASVSVVGHHVAEVKDETGMITTAEENNTAYASIAGTVDADFSAGKNGIVEISGAQFTQAFSTQKDSVVSIDKSLTVAGNAGISLAGTFYANDAAKLDSPKIALRDGAIFYVGGVDVGTTFIKTNEFTTGKNAIIDIAIGDKISFTDNKFPKVALGAETKIQLSFLNSLPVGTLSFLENVGNLTVDSSVVITPMGDVPSVWTGRIEEPLEYRIALVAVVAENIKKGDLVANLATIEPIRLTYKDMPAPHYAIMAALRTCLPGAVNAGVSAGLLDQINTLTTRVELAATYDQFLPKNLVMINELHRKQASVITGAIDRRTRELRNGFPRADAWCEPLFNAYGFSFSADPNLVASSGFRKFAGYDYNTPALFWANGGYSTSESEKTPAGRQTRSKMINASFGIDYAVGEQISLGIFGAYSGGETEYERENSKNSANMRTVGVYLAGTRNDNIGSFYYTGLASYGIAEYDFTRSVEVGTYSDAATASPNGSQIIGYLAAGYEWDLGIPSRGITWAMGPQASLRYVKNSVDGYRETGTEMNQLDVDEFTYDSLVSTLGWRVAYRLNVRDTMTLMPEIRFSWKHEFLRSEEGIGATFVMAPDARYSTGMNKPGSDFAELGVGLTLVVLENMTVSFDYDTQLFRSDSKPDHNFNLMVRCRF